MKKFAKKIIIITMKFESQIHIENRYHYYMDNYTLEICL